MKKPALKLIYTFIITLFFVTALPYNAFSETKNPVRTIDLSTLETMVGEESFDGIVVAMASWCQPCRQELPILAGIYQQYREKGLEIIAISIDTEGPEVVQPLVDNLKIPFPTYWVGKTAIQHFKIVGIPTLLIYQKGQLREKIPGSQSRQMVEEKIRALI